MIDLPIIFSAPMVRALLDGRKTMTRRLAWRWKCRCGWKGDACDIAAPPHPNGTGIYRAPLCPRCGRYFDEKEIKRATSPWQKVKPGDRLWCREAWSNTRGDDSLPTYYKADAPLDVAVSRKFRPSIHMPRWASRLTLVVTATKIEPLNACTDEDAIAEGVVWSEQWRGWVIPGVDHPNPDFPVLSRGTAREAYAALWDVLHGPGKWLSNPECVALTFAVHKQNIDQMRSAA